MSDVSKTSADLLGFIDQTLYANEDGAYKWQNSEVIELLNEIRAIATRVPVQGEPSSDREALARVLYIASDDFAFADRMAKAWDAPGAHGRQRWYRYADAVIAAGFSHSTVPDAATEELEAKLENAKAAAKLSHGFLEIEKEEHAETGAERDAALAAVERVRAIAERQGVKPWTEEIFAALDGAPEPEVGWEYGFELIEPDDRNVFEREGDFISAAFAYRAAKKRIDEEHQADLPRLQYLVVRRRNAGPWLPVHGEQS